MRRLVVACVVLCLLATAQAAGAKYTFRMPTLLTRCVASPYGKYFTVRPPIARSGNGRRQWVYWRGFVYDHFVGKRIAYTKWRRAVATAASPAPFTVSQDVGGSANTNSVGVSVWWYLGNRRWVKKYRHPVRIVYRDVFGTNTFATAC